MSFNQLQPLLNLLNNHTTEAAHYIENLCSPIQEITQTAWIGDEAVDYLINSKIALAASQNIQVGTNIEFLLKHKGIINLSGKQTVHAGGLSFHGQKPTDYGQSGRKVAFAVCYDCNTLS